MPLCFKWTFSNVHYMIYVCFLFFISFHLKNMEWNRWNHFFLYRKYKKKQFFLFGQKVKRTVSENQEKKLSATESINNDWCRLLNNWNGKFPKYRISLVSKSIHFLSFHHKSRFVTITKNLFNKKRKCLLKMLYY